MSKHDKSKLEKQLRNEVYADKFDRRDKTKKRKERRARVLATWERLEAEVANNSLTTKPV